MTRLLWDKVGERFYETGVDHGVLYIPNNQGVYDQAHVWNGLVSVTESPSGAESNPQYADNIKYINLVSAEEFGATIEAFTYPDAFAQCNGEKLAVPGVIFGQQGRRPFGLSYRTLLGNDTLGQDYGYKLHLIYGAQASPSEKAYNTVNDSPEAITFSWEVSTTPVPVEGFKPVASVTVSSDDVSAATLQALEDILYGTAGTDGRLPLPEELIWILGFGDPQEVAPQEPTFANNTITIPTVTGVEYLIDGEVVAAGAHPITQDTVVTAQAKPGYKFPQVTDNDWYYDFI